MKTSQEKSKTLITQNLGEGGGDKQGEIMGFAKVENRPFPISCLPPLQSESKCKVFEMVITYTLHMKSNFHDKNFALRFALKRRQT